MTRTSRNKPGREVPLVGPWSDLPFAQEGGGAATDPAKMLEGFARERASIFEASVDEWNTVPAGLLAVLAEHRKAVARIVVPPGQVNWNGGRSYDGWKGTGFLVGPNLLLTNNHVLNSAEVAAAATIEFDYEWPPSKLTNPGDPATPSTVAFQADPRRLFVTSPAEGGLDYSFVWMPQEAAARFGAIQMRRGSLMIDVDEPTFVIHHPKGRLKEASLDDTELLSTNQIALLYAADTDYGSSGACVFNTIGQLVALHHARRSGADLKAQFPNARIHLRDGRPVTVANEGIKISAIALDLEARAQQSGTDARHAAEILSQVDGSDSLTSIFGGLGRRVEATEDRDRVRSLISATTQDLDIGFWSLKWLASADIDNGQIEAVALAMADINLDVWCLNDAPPRAVRTLADVLRDRFGQVYEPLFVNPQSDGTTRSSVLLSRPDGVSAKSVPWPSKIVDVWTRALSSRAPSVAPPMPSRFQVSSEGRSVDLIPTSLNGVEHDEQLRTRAAEVLIEGIRRVQGVTDWVVGGELRPPLSLSEAATLISQGFELFSARDPERGGAIAYLRGPFSPIETVFLTGDMVPSDTANRVIDIAANRTVDQYFKGLAPMRPTVLRLGFNSHGGNGLDLARRATDVRSVADLFADADSSEPQLSLQSDGPANSGDWHTGLIWQGLSKAAFLRRNKFQLDALIAQVNADLTPRYGAKTRPLTALDLWVIVFCEAGLKDGTIDPDARHSLGERGLLPLPSNITYWIGSGAPAWNKPMGLSINLEAYAVYLGAIKNKSVVRRTGRTLYRDLFGEPGIAGQATRQAKLLAGVVHGYFVSANYSGGSPPIASILASYASDQPIDAMLAGTGYVHSGSPILTNRQRNIDDALQGAQG
ncbi:serine protease [uncultured Tateyamaria sp.]|uniref:trypsin-like serine peptidase n=1 Tax=uncultured Tateyamaria sp. TaxID=455651 RepID=UPI00261D004D|nr:serine protease [uncultured Tateyamaria sp.]